MIPLAMAAISCSNPIDAGGDENENTNDTSTHTNPGSGVSSQTDSLHRSDHTTGNPGVNTVTGDTMSTGSAGGNKK